MRRKTKEIRTANSPHGGEAAASLAARQKSSVGQERIASFLLDRTALEKGTRPMPRVQDTDEVRILRYFEEEPLEKAELLYHIIAEKMRQRMPPGRSSPQKKDMRRNVKSDEEAVTP